jgi:hypothetical protein
MSYAFERDGFINIDINDTGKGVTKNNFEQIFEPGFSTKKRGWGLGLTLARRIIEEYHHGKIFVKDSSTKRNYVSYYFQQLHCNSVMLTMESLITTKLFFCTYFAYQIIYQLQTQTMKVYFDNAATTAIR